LKKEDGQFTKDEIELHAMNSIFYKNLYALEGMKDMDGLLVHLAANLGF